VIYAQQILGYSQRKICRALGQSRGSFRKPKKVKEGEEALTQDIVRLASKYGHYGYKRITSLLKIEGWDVNHKRVERIWRQEGLKVPSRHIRSAGVYTSMMGLVCAFALAGPTMFGVMIL